MQNSYDKKTVIITGSSKGIGAATAIKYAEKNYNVVINYLTDEQSAINLSNELKNK